MTTFREYLAATQNADEALSRPIPMPAGARQIQGERAGFASRFIAAFIDFLVIFGVVLGTVAVLWMLSFVINPVTVTSPDTTEGARRVPPIVIMVLYGYFLNWIYWTVCWATSGRTIGNLIMGIRVINRHGNRLNWFWAAVRSFFCTMVPIGLAWAIISRSNRSVQDVVMRTSVIYDWVVGLPNLSEIFRKARSLPRTQSSKQESAQS